MSRRKHDCDSHRGMAPSGCNTSRSVSFESQLGRVPQERRLSFANADSPAIETEHLPHPPIALLR